MQKMLILFNSMKSNTSRVMLVLSKLNTSQMTHAKRLSVQKHSEVIRKDNIYLQMPYRVCDNTYLLF